MTQNIDTPSNVFATLNPLDPVVDGTYSNGNTKYQTTAGNKSYVTSTLGVSSGKYYMEVRGQVGSGVYEPMYGIYNVDNRDTSDTNTMGSQSDEYAYRGTDGNIYNNNTATAYGDSISENDILGIAVDLDNSKLYFSKNGVWQNSGDPTSGATGTGAVSITSGLTYSFGFGDNGGVLYINIEANFGNGYFGTTAVSSAQNPDDEIGIFEYDVPAGYYALCTKSINAQEYD
jgi:hypothetical protein